MPREPRSRSLERFSPAFGAAERQGTVLSAVVNLTSTILGGGMLSLPFALERSGLVPGLLLLGLTAVASDYSIYTLVSCSRRSGAQTYEAVAEAAFGRHAKQLSMALVVTVTYVPLIAYSILLRDLLAPILEHYLLSHELGTAGRNILAGVALAGVSPACFLRSLNSLRLLSLASVLAVMLLASAVLVRSIQCARGDASNWSGVNLWPHGGLNGALQGLPIFVCAYVCHFNVLPVHGELARPTRHRLHRMVHATMAIVTLFYTTVSVSGYVYGVCAGHLGGNILNSFPDGDILVNLGRLGLSATILLSFPLMVVPCRDTILRVFAEAYLGGGRKASTAPDGKGGKAVPLEDSSLSAASASPRGGEAEITEPLLPSLESEGAAAATGSVQAQNASVRDAENGYGGSGSSCSSSERREVPALASAGLTATILVSQFAIAASLNDVAVVWGLLGSSANVLVAFVVPSAAYLRIRKYQQPGRPGSISKRKRASRLLLATSSAVAVACTANSLYLVAKSS